MFFSFISFELDVVRIRIFLSSIEPDVVRRRLLPELRPLLVVSAGGLQAVGPTVGHGLTRHRNPTETK